MAKLPDLTFKRMPPDLVDFKDSVLDLVNRGKYQMSVLTTDPPTHRANPGEFALTLTGGSARFYIATSINSWTRMISVAT